MNNNFNKFIYYIYEHVNIKDPDVLYLTLAVNILYLYVYQTGKMCELLKARVLVDPGEIWFKNIIEKNIRM